MFAIFFSYDIHYFFSVIFALLLVTLNIPHLFLFNDILLTVHHNSIKLIMLATNFLFAYIQRSSAYKRSN
jgi:hypothetical protein